MFISTLIAAHMATGIVKAFHMLKNADEVFCESALKYAKLEGDHGFNSTVAGLRREHPKVLTWSASECKMMVHSLSYAIFAVKGFFTLIPSKEKLKGDAFIKVIRDQHPKIKQGLIS